ncbi:hypothetical protein GCM10028775_46060 [Catellatospora paridis]
MCGGGLQAERGRGQQQCCRQRGGQAVPSEGTVHDCSSGRSGGWERTEAKTAGQGEAGKGPSHRAEVRQREVLTARAAVSRCAGERSVGMSQSVRVLVSGTPDVSGGVAIDCDR